jgi:hypothetical protein
LLAHVLELDLSQWPDRSTYFLAPSGAGIDIVITATDPNRTGSYIRNIRLVYAPNEALLAGGENLQSGFRQSGFSFRSIRVMNWMGGGLTLQSTRTRRLTRL